jgi:F-type H+-transporting ATPase subunit a
MIHLLASDNPIHHVVDQRLDWLHNDLTMHMVTLVVAGLLGLAVLLRAASAIKVGSEHQGMHRYMTRGRLSQLVEVVSIYLIENTIRPLLGKDTNRFLPFLLSLFFFILVCNLLGLVPTLDVQHIFTGVTDSDSRWMLFGGTATANLAVTLGLGLTAFAAIQYQGFRSLGIKGWCKHLAGGAPLYLLPIMLPVELLGLFIKPVALAIRLFANMVAGHTLLAVIASFGTVALNSTQSWIAGGSITLVSIIAAIPISFLELFVAFLQAFIFMFLTTVFIGQMTHHDEEHDEDEAHSDQKALATS